MSGPMFNPSNLPVPQLESLKFKANQIIESIQALQRTIDVGGQNVMPAWPDILSKYNIILSQTHSFSTSLIASQTVSQAAHQSSIAPRPTGSMFERIALHPSVALPDATLDNEIIPLLRNQQTTDVLSMENETARRLAECMHTGGAVRMAGVQSNQVAGGGAARTRHEDVLAECAQIRGEHDRRVDRAVRAVTMLRDKFEWKQRVEVEVEEPEEIEWSARHRQHHDHDGDDVDMGHEGDHGDVDEGQSSDDEELVEGALTDVNGDIGTPAEETSAVGTPAVDTPADEDINMGTPPATT